MAEHHEWVVSTGFMTVHINELHKSPKGDYQLWLANINSRAVADQIAMEHNNFPVVMNALKRLLAAVDLDQQKCGLPAKYFGQDSPAAEAERVISEVEGAMR